MAFVYNLVNFTLVILNHRISIFQWVKRDYDTPLDKSLLTHLLGVACREGASNYIVECMRSILCFNVHYEHGKYFWMKLAIKPILSRLINIELFIAINPKIRFHETGSNITNLVNKIISWVFQLIRQSAVVDCGCE